MQERRPRRTAPRRARMTWEPERHAAPTRESRYPPRRVTDPNARSPQLGVNDADVVRELVGPAS